MTKGGLDPYLLREGKRRVSPLSAGFRSRRRARQCAVEGFKPDGIMSCRNMR